MNKIKHHLTDALLMGYAAGTLPEAFNLVVATHISMCDTCRAALAEFDAVGGEVMVDTDPVDMAEDALAQAMARIGTGAPLHKPQTKSVTGLFPAPLRDYVGGDLEHVTWRRVGGGVSQMVLPTASGASVRLLRIPAGTAVPDHGHRGLELTLVLQGAFVDETDRFAAGDIEVANEDLNHKPVAEAGMDCICLAATDAPLRFNGLVPRLAQRFIGI
ncbi:ChrR family anti-sigma-E factor [Yoonia sp.]|uniref:ChrR family anti-sigma-E factor n=1 Tax=Yoonia sp. TaxID=2212373 RepID=UPI00391893E1